MKPFAYSSCGRALIASAAIASLGCVAPQGSSRTVSPATLSSHGGWTIVPRVPLVLQRGSRDCGAAALSAVLSFWGRPASPEQITALESAPDARLSAGDLERYARGAGLSSYVFFGNLGDVIYEIRHGRPVIVGVGKPIGKDRALSHYEVVVGVDESARRVLLLDPGSGWQEDTFEGFGREWAVSRGVTIVAFLDRPPPKLPG